MAEVLIVKYTNPRFRGYLCTTHSKCSGSYFLDSTPDEQDEERIGQEAAEIAKKLIRILGVMMIFVLPSEMRVGIKKWARWEDVEHAILAAIRGN